MAAILDNKLYKTLSSLQKVPSASTWTFDSWLHNKGCVRTSSRRCFSMVLTADHSWGKGEIEGWNSNHLHLLWIYKCFLAFTSTARMWRPAQGSKRDDNFLFIFFLIFIMGRGAENHQDKITLFYIPALFIILFTQFCSICYWATLSLKRWVYFSFTCLSSI